MIPDDERKAAFLDAIEIVMRRYGISIDHEDSQGAFLLVPFDEDVMWHLRQARTDVLP